MFIFLLVWQLSGLLTPIIKNACGVSLIQISERAKVLLIRLEIKNYLQMKWLILLSPLLTGNVWNRFISGIVNPPNAAILSVGSSSPKPVIVKKRTCCPRRDNYAGLSCDHGQFDGALAADFLKMLATHLESPATFLV